MVLLLNVARKQNAGSENSGNDAHITYIIWPCINASLFWRQVADVVLMALCFIIRLNKRSGVSEKDITTDVSNVMLF